MVASIELQVISKLLTCDEPTVVDELCSFDSSYYSIFQPHAQFILKHYLKYNNVPDIFTFQSQFPDITLVKVSESLDYLKAEMCKNKQHILLLETFNKLKDLGSGDVTDAWKYLSMQCDAVSKLDDTQPLDLVHDAQERSRQVIENSKYARIPTGFDEIDKLMYGGLSTVEELVILVARTNTGKSWVGTLMMESAQKHGFPVLYYSPEMQASFLGTRFDTWRGNFANSDLFQGKYTAQYYEYLKALQQEDTSAFILEDKDVSEGSVNVDILRRLVRKNHIKLLVIDGLSYMEDIHKADRDTERYKHLCEDLFRISKEEQCAVVIMMQANRETKDNKDDKGEVFPNIYNIEGSDHPARIATLVFAMRQIFDKHILDIRLEKGRLINNQKPEFSYSWDINTGNKQYIPNGQGDAVSAVLAPTVTPGDIVPIISAPSDEIILDDNDEVIEF